MKGKNQKLKLLYLAKIMQEKTDDTHYLTMYSLETLGGTIEAYQYPEEFKACNGEKELTTGVVIGQQTRKGFGLAFESLIGNDTESIDHGRSYIFSMVVRHHQQRLVTLQ